MKITASNTQQVAQSIAKSTNQVFQEKMKVSENPSFQERLGDGLKKRARTCSHVRVTVLIQKGAQ